MKEKGVSCALLDVADGGAIRIDANGVRRTVTLRGVTLRPDSAAAINSMFERLRAQQMPVRCTLLADRKSSTAVADIEYLAWRDKSGDVWQDLAVTLVEEGLARPEQP